MCGIAGFVGKKFQNEDIENYIKLINHRGPDETGFFKSLNAQFATARLSIIDKIGGHQPFYNEDRTVVVVFNGQIYNHKELSNLLSDSHIMNSKSDGEVIAHLYEEFGELWVEKVEGMFAVAIWDIKKQELLLYRDRFGKKPLYYTSAEDGIAFSSEIRVLKKLLNLKKADYNSNSINLFLNLGYIPNPNTIYKHIYKLEPGFFLKFQNFQTKFSKYFSLNLNQVFNEDKLYSIGSLIDQAVAKRLESERPIGVFLSGGIDSSLIAESMVRQSKDSVLSFSIGFEDKNIDESSRASEVSRAIRTNHMHHVIPNNLTAIEITGILEHLDEPFGDSSYIAMYILSKFASENIVVALSGDGGDEIFGGYRRYNANSILQKKACIYNILHPVQKILIKNLGVLNSTRKLEVLKNLPLDSSKKLGYTGFIKSLSDSEIDLAIKRYSHVDFQKWFLAENSRNEINSTLNLDNQFDILHYLPDDILFKVDHASMANSIEVRSPFLDLTLANFGLNLDENERIVSSGKPILRELIKKRIPQYSGLSLKKGFAVPKSFWMLNSLKSLMDDYVYGKNSAIFDYLNSSYIKKIYPLFVNHGWYSDFFWNFFVLETWLRNNEN